MMTPIAEARLIQIPTLRPAKKKSSGIEIARTSTMIVAGHRAGSAAGSGHGSRKRDPNLPEGDDEHDRNSEEEHDLAANACVPAGHRHLHPRARARVPPREGRHREHDAREQSDTVSDAEETSPRGSNRPADLGLEVPSGAQMEYSADAHPRLHFVLWHSRRVRRARTTLRCDHEAVRDTVRLHRARRRRLASPTASARDAPESGSGSCCSRSSSRSPRSRS